MSSRIPPPLEPYLLLPSEASLILLTSVLGASSNWLVLRFLHSALIGSDSAPDNLSGDEPKVLLVSFMRDLAFWKENGRRLGLDLDKFAAKKRFIFVDGLSSMFTPKQQKAALGKTGEKKLNNSNLASISGDVNSAIQSLNDGAGTGKILLVVDQIDLLLAAGGDQIASGNVGEMVFGWCEDVHATILSLSADLPLVSTNQTPLENNHAALLLNVAHQADFIMSLRLLDSGTARDVSGVIRITADDPESGGRQKGIEEKELLYFVGGDGGVRVFERGQ